nr:uncharacterized protein LOC120367575 [Saimiri boliviensis boliviensis]
MRSFAWPCRIPRPPARAWPRPALPGLHALLPRPRIHLTLLGAPVGGGPGWVQGNSLAAHARGESCAARSSSVPNKPFKVSGARKFSEIKGRRGGDLFHPDLLSSAVWPPVGIPPNLQLASPGNQPPFFLFLTGKGDRLASGCLLQTCRQSPVWRGR